MIERTVVGVPLKFIIATREAQSWYGIPGREWNSQELLEVDALGLVTAGDRVLDVGCHHGMIAAWYAARVGKSGRVVAIDPMPHHTVIARLMAKLNELDNMEVVTAAVGEERGTIGLDPTSGIVTSGTRLTAAEMVRVDDFAGMAPTLLKIDVEGYEGAVLRGARRVLETTPNLHIEVHPAFAKMRFGETVNEALAAVDWDRYDRFACGAGETGLYERVEWEPGTPVTTHGAGILLARRRPAASRGALRRARERR